MRKFFKITGITLAALLLLVLFAPTLLRGKIERIVKREANAMLDARLDFERLGISLLRHFPNASLQLKGLSVRGTGDFEGDTLLAARRISVVVNPASIFAESGFEVRKVVLDAPSITAIRNEQGLVNWNIMRSNPETQPAAEEPEEAGPSSFRLSMRDVRVEEGRLLYRDDSTQTYCYTDGLHVRLSGGLSAVQSDIRLLLRSGDIYCAAQGSTLVKGAEAELRADIAADLEQGRYTLRENTLRLNAVTLSLDGWVQMLDEGLETDLKLNTSKVDSATCSP